MPTLNNRRERFLSHEEADLLLTELAKVSGKLLMTKLCFHFIVG